MTSDALNDSFHDAYDEAREQAQGAPLFVVLADALVVCRDGRKRTLSFEQPAFHVLKSAAHGPVGLFALLASLSETGSNLDDGVRVRLERLRAALVQAQSAFEPLGAAERQDASAVVMASLRFLDRVRASVRVEREILEKFAAETGPLLLRLTDHATALRLAALDRAVEDALADLTLSERTTFRVVVAGDHQARARSLAMQYFSKRLGPGENGDERVIYGESIDTPEEALALAATQRIDRTIAKAFFGDAKKLQRDILGDSATALLEKRPLARIC